MEFPLPYDPPWTDLAREVMLALDDNDNNDHPVNDRWWPAIVFDAPEGFIQMAKALAAADPTGRGGEGALNGGDADGDDEDDEPSSASWPAQHARALREIGKAILMRQLQSFGSSKSSSPSAPSPPPPPRVQIAILMGRHYPRRSSLASSRIVWKFAPDSFRTIPLMEVFVAKYLSNTTSSINEEQKQEMEAVQATILLFDAFTCTSLTANHKKKKKSSTTSNNAVATVANDDQSRHYHSTHDGVAAANTRAATDDHRKTATACEPPPPPAAAAPHPRPQQQQQLEEGRSIKHPATATRRLGSGPAETGTAPTLELIKDRVVRTTDRGHPAAPGSSSSSNNNNNKDHSDSAPTQSNYEPATVATIPMMMKGETPSAVANGDSTHHEQPAHTTDNGDAPMMMETQEEENIAAMDDANNNNCDDIVMAEANEDAPMAHNEESSFSSSLPIDKTNPPPILKDHHRTPIKPRRIMLTDEPIVAATPKTAKKIQTNAKTPKSRANTKTPKRSAKKNIPTVIRPRVEIASDREIQALLQKGGYKLSTKCCVRPYGKETCTTLAQLRTSLRRNGVNCQCKSEREETIACQCWTVNEKATLFNWVRSDIFSFAKAAMPRQYRLLDNVAARSVLVDLGFCQNRKGALSYPGRADTLSYTTDGELFRELGKDGLPDTCHFEGVTDEDRFSLECFLAFSYRFTLYVCHQQKNSMSRMILTLLILVCVLFFAAIIDRNDAAAATRQ
jgi:hypothetical protein